MVLTDDEIAELKVSAQPINTLFPAATVLDLIESYEALKRAIALVNSPAGATWTIARQEDL
jgi:hypothetical protein